MAFAYDPDRTTIVEMGRIQEISDLAGIYSVKWWQDGDETRKPLLRNLTLAKCAVNDRGNHSVRAGGEYPSRHDSLRRRREGGDVHGAWPRAQSTLDASRRPRPRMTDRRHAARGRAWEGRAAGAPCRPLSRAAQPGRSPGAPARAPTDGGRACKRRARSSPSSV